MGGLWKAVGTMRKRITHAPRWSSCVLKLIAGFLGGLFVFLSIASPLTATAQTPSAARAAGLRGVEEQRAGNYEKSIAEFDIAIRLDPTNWGAYADRGNNYAMLGQFQRAIDDFDAALRIKRDARIYRLRGMAYRRLGQYDRALQDMNEALRLDPQFADGYNTLAWLHATAMDEKFRDGRKAVELATRASELTGWKNATIIDTLAAAYAAAGNFAEAVKWQETSFTLPDSLLEPDASRARLEMYRKGIAHRE
jgi:tetratricopeptide (TPR) repeat protein